MTCADLEEDPPPGYVSTCSHSVTEDFGADVEQSDGHLIDACCLPASPVDAVDPFCRIDAAEEICLRLFYTIEERRKKLPVTAPGLEAELADLKHQLDNLSKYLADGDTQTECTLAVGMGLKSEGDFQDSAPVVQWIPVHPDELDPDLGWPWFRGLQLGIKQFELDGFDESDEACDALANQTVDSGTITAGQLSISSYFGSAAPSVTGGHFSFRSVDCPFDNCEFAFDEFVVEIEDFFIDPLTFSDVSVTMSASTQGLINAPSIQFGEGTMRFSAQFRLTNGTEPVFDGELVSVDLTNAGVATARLMEGPLFGIQHIAAENWPFSMSLSTELTSCDE
ncbi:hypothetical protein [Nannocystis pusilla]|uniref:Uncharacterized protein n=1 Tax=Nannocystis pusilla TaxID=889268 RepID=A0ABS7TXT6_9BACT|nr:hypothetical protein [Nannocystis pusilla]MBZ5713004.1 hypothetical protein [Nannocystis pusilla]